jgi:hypothetical protein
MSGCRYEHWLAGTVRAVDAARELCAVCVRRPVRGLTAAGRFSVREELTGREWECTFANAVPFPAPGQAEPCAVGDVVLARVPDDAGALSATLFPADVLAIDTDDARACSRTGCGAWARG